MTGWAYLHTAMYAIQIDHVHICVGRHVPLVASKGEGHIEREVGLL